jgi:predicted nucleotidyltransferase
VFSLPHREKLRQLLVGRAEADDRLVAAAVTGSRAEGREDRWSDIDLYLGVRDDVPVAEVLEDWSAFIYEHLDALHHFDLTSAIARYRAFVLGDGLEVDLGFAPAADFGPVGDGQFDVLFGAAGPRRPAPPNTDYLVGMVWHHVLHARAAIERGTLWRAEHWITSTRDVLLSLASIRHGLPHTYARGADALPAEVLDPVHATLVRELTVAEVVRALRAVTRIAVTELAYANPDVATRLSPLLNRAGVEELNAGVEGESHR